jgi:hypothetical protein
MLPDGRYRLEVGADGRIVRHLDVDVAAAMPLEPMLIRLERGGTIEVSVPTVDGLPAFAFGWVVREGADRTRRCSSTEDGVITFAGLEPGVWQVTASSSARDPSTPPSPLEAARGEWVIDTTVSLEGAETKRATLPAPAGARGLHGGGP